MIDAGNPSDEHELERMMRENAIDPGSSSHLLLTHGHLDHAGTAAYFQDTYAIKVIGGEGDQTMIGRGGRAELCPTGMFAKLIQVAQRGAIYPTFTLDIASPSRPATPF